MFKFFKRLIGLENRINEVRRENERMESELKRIKDSLTTIEARLKEIISKLPDSPFDY